MSSPSTLASLIKARDLFFKRHIGPTGEEQAEMLSQLGYSDMASFVKAVIPGSIYKEGKDLDLPEGLGEQEALNFLKEKLRGLTKKRNFIGLGYYNSITPPVIQRSILENPSWYTQYTPYQAEIAQGRLEALLNYQTMVSDLCGLEVSNASLLDEASAAAEALTLAFNVNEHKERNSFLVESNTHPQTIAVLNTRARALGVELKILDLSELAKAHKAFGILISYPGSDGSIADIKMAIRLAKDQGLLVALATDLLALCLLESPGSLGADIALGSSQRFGIPLGFGGPHAAFFATKGAYARKIPGRLVGVSKDREGKQALRLSLQTREQHIRRDKATSNICTAQVLLAIMAGMYGAYHGPEGLKTIAKRVAALTELLAEGLKEQGFVLANESFFDTIRIAQLSSSQRQEILKRAQHLDINLRLYGNDDLGLSLDECTTLSDVSDLLFVFSAKKTGVEELGNRAMKLFPRALKNQRQGSILSHPIFNAYHSETELLRYIKSLEQKDLSLAHAMIPLGSCTMKLNAAAELYPISWPEISGLHPFQEPSQVRPYIEMCAELEKYLCVITGFDAFSLQPNSGAQGEYAGLLAIRAFHDDRGDHNRKICLIPSSAHGTNPASAVLAGLKVVIVACDSEGNVDIKDLKNKAEHYQKELAALMITYPSTHGVYEEGIVEICALVHQYGGQVYMDGANLNAQVGLCYAGSFGPDVCHLNLHKTFCIPHGGGGPGVGPVGVKKHLIPYLPSHPLLDVGGKKGFGPVSAAPYGSAGILPISWMYINLMGGQGLKKATEAALLSANYIANSLSKDYAILFKGANGLVAHECIVDLGVFKKTAQIEVDDVAKRLIDYGFHAPTVSWPVPGSLMIEPTESESKRELDRFIAAMKSIRAEIRKIEEGQISPVDNMLKGAPHSLNAVLSQNWDRPYSVKEAVYPMGSQRKFWPSVSRIDNAYGDRNLVCTCPSPEDYV